MDVIHYAEMWLNTYLVVLSEWWVGLQQGLHRHWSIENSLPPDSECLFRQVSHRMLVGLGFFVLKGQHLDMPVMGGFILTMYYQRESWNVWHLKFSNSLCGSHFLCRWLVLHWCFIPAVFIRSLRASTSQSCMMYIGTH